MGRRQILNISSKKKQDNMAPVVTDNAGGSVTPGPLRIVGNVPMMLLWCATARDRESPTGSDTTISVRESDICYMRGLKEKINITTNSAASWHWRRICFTAKGINSLITAVDSVQTSVGWTRMMTNINNTTSGNFLLGYVFRGSQGVDWNDAFTAKVDTNRVTLKYDKTRIFASGNQLGRYFKHQNWLPMNKNLHYSNDEAGETESNDTHSSLGKAGMGDYYILDFFTCATNTAGDTMDFTPEATLYWHEK